LEKSELDRKVEQALCRTCDAITTVMSEVIWDSDQMKERYPGRLFTLLHRAAKLIHIVARAQHLLAEVRLKASIVHKEKALAELAKAEQEFGKARAGVAKSIRV
jgi:hypothetical protein